MEESSISKLPSSLHDTLPSSKLYIFKLNLTFNLFYALTGKTEAVPIPLLTVSFGLQPRTKMNTKLRVIPTSKSAAYTTDGCSSTAFAFPNCRTRLDIFRHQACTTTPHLRNLEASTSTQQFHASWVFTLPFLPNSFTNHNSAGAYQKYKRATEHFVDWICNTAANHGSSIRCNSGGTEGEYAVSTEEIRRQAQFLADHAIRGNVKFTMSTRVWQAYLFARGTRERYARLYGDLADAGHAYFNAMLSEVLQLIKDHVKVDKLARAVAEKDTAIPCPFGGLFDSLTVEDVLDDTETPTPHISTPHKARERYTPKVDSLSMIRMEFFCLLEDSENLFEYIRQSVVGEGNFIAIEDQVVASLLTEAAVVIIGQREQDWLDSLAKEETRYIPVLATGPLDRFWLPSVSLEDVSEARMAYRDIYRLPIKQLRDRVPNIQPGASPAAPPLLEPWRYALYEELDSRLVRYMLDLNLESVSQ